jgi:hypothetical protein
MNEETEFWGVTVEGYDQCGHRGKVLLGFPGNAPARKGFRFYPVFSSREHAEEFVREQWQHLSPQLMKQTLGHIRQIKRHEVPGDHCVTLDHGDLVMWAELLAEH